MVKSILHDLIALNNILEQWKHALPNFSTGIGIHSSTVLMIHNRDKLHLTRCKNSRKNHLRTLPTRPTPINETESRNLVFSKRIRPNAFLKPQAPLQPKGAKNRTFLPLSPIPQPLTIRVDRDPRNSTPKPCIPPRNRPRPPNRA